MQIKSTKIYHLTSIRIVNQKMTENNKRWCECGKIEILFNGWWQYKMLQLLWKTAWWVFKQINRTTTGFCGKFLKRWEYQTTWPACWEICMQVKKQQLELDVEQQTGSKSGWEYVKAIYCHPAYLTYIQSTSWEMLEWMKHKLESTLLGEISITSDVQMTPPSESEEELKSLLMKVKEESEQSGLKLNIQKTKIIASGPISSWEIDGETMETVRDYCFGFQNHCRWWLQPWN